MSVLESIVYLSGPMTNIEDYNRPAFHAAAKQLREEGYTVFNPAEGDPHPDWVWEDWLRKDLAEMLKCSSIYLLPNWQASSGATLEVAVAAKLSMPIIDYETRKPLIVRSSLALEVN
jgi:hypothetical protein